MLKADFQENDYYYASAETEDWLTVFWGDVSPFAKAFAHLDLKHVVELACGRGRHTAQIVSRAGTIILVDINDTNVEACKKRFADHKNIRYFVCSGSDLSDIPSASQTALFCYDSMVHFELEDVISYLKETSRILCPGGRALFHYSNNSQNPGSSYRDNPHWRNFGSEPTFRHLAIRSGFRVLSSEILPWGEGPDFVEALDALTLLELTEGAQALQP
jgi:ubiquinone/menaquinone biosynthesis C-methylase UbiE